MIWLFCFKLPRLLPSSSSSRNAAIVLNTPVVFTSYVLVKAAVSQPRRCLRKSERLGSDGAPWRLGPTMPEFATTTLT